MRSGGVAVRANPAVPIGSILALNDPGGQAGMSVLHSPWIDHVLADCEHLEPGGLLEVVSFITLVAMIALAGLSVVLVTFLYAI